MFRCFFAVLLPVPVPKNTCTDVWKCVIVPSSEDDGGGGREDEDDEFSRWQWQAKVRPQLDLLVVASRSARR